MKVIERVVQPQSGQAEALARAVSVLGGVGALAKAVGATPSSPSMWRSRARVPAEYCPPIERETRKLGQPVLCEELRPDVEWGVLRAAAPVGELAAAADQAAL